MVQVVKRNGTFAKFDKTKIVDAITKAMVVGGSLDKTLAELIALDIEKKVSNMETVDISQIETMVFTGLCEHGESLTAKAYESYRSIREFQREHKNRIEEQVEDLVDGNSDYWNNENSNKNAKLVTTQRDYMAGIVSTEITRKYLLPPDVLQAHDTGLIHFHDADYFGQRTMHNCSLINLDDMLQNGTVINNVAISKPHRLITATTLATQIITAVTSSQYGLM